MQISDTTFHRVCISIRLFLGCDIVLFFTFAPECLLIYIWILIFQAGCSKLFDEINQNEQDEFQQERIICLNIVIMYFELHFFFIVRTVLHDVYYIEKCLG